MNICGIVCEYNPFHKGHLYQLEESKRQLGEETVTVGVMSGDFAAILVTTSSIAVLTLP